MKWFGYYVLYKKQGGLKLENNNFSKAEEIKKLKELLDEGILTKEEFEIEKKKNTK